MRTLRIPEFGVERNVPLAPNEMATLRSFPRLITITSSIDGVGYDLAAGSWVGVIQSRDFVMEIVPKVPIPELLFLLSYAAAKDLWRTDAFQFATASSILDGIAGVFGFITRRALEHGVLHGHRTTDDSSLVVHGSLRFADQIRIRYGRMPPAEIRFDEYTEDIEENRLIRAAAYRWGRLRLHNPRTRQDLRSIAVSLQNVGHKDYDHGIPEVHYTRLNERFRPAVELARLILGTLTIQSTRGHAEAVAFGADMNKVFEDFVVRALRVELQVTEAVLPQAARGKSLYLDAARRIRLEPDLSLWHGERCLMVGDAKYKRLSVSRFLHADIYQMLAYLTATNLRKGLLIYAAGEAEPTHHVLPDGRLIEVVGLHLHEQPEGILKQIKAIAQQIGQNYLALPVPNDTELVTYWQ